MTLVQHRLLQTAISESDGLETHVGNTPLLPTSEGRWATPHAKTYLHGVRALSFLFTGWPFFFWSTK